MKKKLIVLGLDGACFSVIKPMISSGDLPGFSELIEGGASGTLHIDENERGWPAILTGKRADVNGSLYYRKQPGQYRAEMTFDPKQISGQTIFDVLGQRGARVLSINVPLTYPCWNVSGIMVSGAGGGTKPKRESFIYPKKYSEKYREYLDNYIVDVRRSDYNHKSAIVFVNDIITMTEKRIEMVEAMLEHETWDMAFPAFVGMDRIQHWVWDAIPHIGENQENDLTSVILKYYKIIDNFIAKLRTNYPETTIMVVSDHGFQPIKHYLYMQDFLSSLSLFKKKTNIINSLVTIAKKILRSSPALRAKVMATSSTSFSKKAFQMVAEWKETKAFGDRSSGVYINTIEHPEGIVDDGAYGSLRKEISEELEKCRYCSTKNERLFTNIRFREDAYTGTFSELAPDIIFSKANGIEIMADQAKLLNRNYLSRRRIVKKWGKMPAQRQGIHSNQALFIANGNNIKAGGIHNNYGLQSFVNTVLKHFNFEIELECAEPILDIFRS